LLNRTATTTTTTTAAAAAATTTTRQHLIEGLCSVGLEHFHPFQMARFPLQIFHAPEKERKIERKRERKHGGSGGERWLLVISIVWCI
jgi:hypothetical protein